VGDAWVDHVREHLRMDNRATTGGWPGTLREARARTYAHLATVRHRSVSPDELELATRAVYDRARHRWLASALVDHEGDA
jgi:hypothetical protein